MKRLVLASLALAPLAHARDAFDDVTCGNDVARALLRKKIPGKVPVMKLEALHKAIALHDLGGDGEDMPYFLTFWSICGDTYVVLDDMKHAKNRDVVMDVAKLPAETPTKKLRMANRCHVSARTLDDVFYFDDPATKVVSDAWQVDAKKMKLVPLDVAGLTCPADE